MTDSSRLVDRQLRLVEIKRELEQLGHRPPPVKVGDIHYGPCLLLSREAGSGGDDIAQRVGERLGWHVFDSELVEDIAQRAHVRRQLVQSVDEHIRSHWHLVLHPIRERAGIKPETYLYHLHEIVLTLGHQGDVVIIGRGAQFLLPPQCAVRVRIVAPRDVRIARVAAAQHWTTELATQVVKKTEADRAAFIYKLFHEDTASPLNYDLVINTADVSVEAAAALILAALEVKLRVHPEPVACAR